MELFIIRHGDPDYARDSLTEKGVREAKLLSERMEKENIDYFYCSPLGRAQKTASYTMEKYPDKEMPTLEWAREFREQSVRVLSKSNAGTESLPIGQNLTTTIHTING